jgi:choline-sulfatase
MKNLYFFDDIRISKIRKGARLINFLSQFFKAAVDNKLLFFSFVCGIFFLSVAVSRYLVIITDSKFVLTGLIVVIELITACFIFISVFIASFISNRFRCKLNTGFRDSWFLLLPVNAYILTMLPVRDIIFIYSFFLTGLSAIIAIGILIYYYKKNIATKKQPDLDVPYILDADKKINFIKPKSAEFKKIQINGDTRDALILDTQQEQNIELSCKSGVIKFAVALREDVPSVPVKVEVFDTTKDTCKLIYSKVLDPLNDHNARSWIDIETKLASSSTSELHSICIKTQMLKNSGKEVKGKRVCFYGPIPSNAKDPKKIIIIVLDAVRADHIGCYGYNRDVSSNIDSLSKDSVIFESAMVQGDWTLPSFMSILTGMFPSAHHVYSHDIYNKLNPEVVTLPEALRQNGFITRSYFTHVRLMSHFGFAKGFDSHIFRQCDKVNKIATADQVTDDCLDILEFHRNDNLFLMMHYFDTHQPCDPPSPYSDIFDKIYGRGVIKNIRQKLLSDKGLKVDNRDLYNLIARYDAEIKRVDFKIGIVMDYLKRSGQYDDSMIIVTGDHGMLLNEHGSLSQIKLFDEILKVPLLIKFPNYLGMGKSKSINSGIVQSNIDLMPTILDTFNISKPATIQGNSLISLDSRPKNNKFAISESLFNNTYAVSLRDEDYRYTFKTGFDISKFTNYKEEKVEEELFNAYKGKTELKIEKSNCGDIIKKYRSLIRNHIDSILKAHISKKGQL